MGRRQGGEAAAWRGGRRYRDAVAAAVTCLVVLGLGGAPAAWAETQGEAVVKVAAAQLGVPYCYGGGTTTGPTVGITDPESDGSYSNCSQIGKVGFDCSGLVMYAVYQALGIRLPHNVASQREWAANHGVTVITNPSDLQPGDVVVFGDRDASPPYQHNGIYVGSHAFSSGPWGTGTGPAVLNAYSERYGIVYSPLSWWTSSTWYFDEGIRFWHEGSSGPPAEGSYVQVPGSKSVYRVVGGAPIPVTSWAAVGGEKPVVTITQAQFDALAEQPRDDTLISGYGNATVYITAGGAPIAIHAWSAVGGQQGRTVYAVDPSTIAHAGDGGAWDHLNRVPADGTFVKGYGNATIYRTAGGAPIAIGSLSVFEAIHRSGVSVTMIDQAALNNAGGAGAWSHLNRVPADGTFIKGYGHAAVYRVAGGAPLAIGSLHELDRLNAGDAPVTEVDQEAIEKAGQAGAWRYLNKVPADGTAVAAGGTMYVLAGGAPIAIASWSRVGGPKPSTEIDPAALENAGGAGAWSHLRAFPADATILRAGPEGPLYEVRAGAPYPITALPAGASPVVVDPVAIANAGQAGAWRYLLAPVPERAPEGESAGPGPPSPSQGGSQGSSSVGQVPAGTPASSGVDASRTTHTRGSDFSVESLGRRARTRLFRTGELVVYVRVHEAGRIWLTLLAQTRGHHDTLVGRMSMVAKHAGIIRLALRISGQARSALRGHHRTALLVRVHFSHSHQVQGFTLPPDGR